MPPVADVPSESIDDSLQQVIAIDHELTGIERTLNFLLYVTPVNVSEAWTDFEKSGFDHPPGLRLRPLDFDPDLAMRRLFALEIERVEDATLSLLLTEKRDELARQITLLKDRDTSRFAYGSLQLFGEVGEALVAEAEEILARVSDEPSADSRVTATAFAEAAQTEFDLYRSRYPDFEYGLDVRTDISDLMVLHGRLLIPATASFSNRRVAPLIQHEVGTHVITYANGVLQPLKLLSVGLPGYEETQEGLAVLAEFAVGGLSPQRMRVLAARVVAVHRLLQGVGFLEIFNELHESHGFGPHSAWSIAVRVNQGGGLTKDVIYLRGLERVLEFASQRKDLSQLFIGKLSLEQIAVIDELLQREFLKPPHVMPHWYESPDAQGRLQAVYQGVRPIDLIDSKDFR
ncbi:MAG: flavohemoglobin expression-modulating QEGLA motif protein [Actinomycetota bacterium]|nr:flavohemoglobin expression-modulating QEGLA motif protein [Actinomycetota bacterium]